MQAKAAGMTGPPSGLTNLYVASQYGPGPKIDDPSEPIYTDPSLFEQRSRSSRNIANIGKSMCNEFN